MKKRSRIHTHSFYCCRILYSSNQVYSVEDLWSSKCFIDHRSREIPGKPLLEVVNHFVTTTFINITTAVMKCHNIINIVTDIHNHDCDPYSGCNLKVLPNNLFPNLPSLVWLDVRYFVAHIEKIVRLEPFADFQGQFADYVPFNLERLAKIEGGPFYASVRSI